MNYIVQTKKLKSLINPFEQKINGLKITIEDVKEALSNNDIVANPKDSELKQFISQVAFKVANYKNEEIKIVVPDNSDTEFNSSDILKEGLAHFAASIFKGEDTVIANVQGNEKIIKTLLDINLSKPDNVFIEREEKFQLLNWDAHIDTLKQFKEEDTNNLDYISKAYCIKQEKEEVKEKFLKEIPIENWSNKDFIIKMLETDSDILGILPQEIVLENNFLHIVATYTDIENFKNIFDMYLKKPFLLEIKTQQNKENKEFLENSNLSIEMKSYIQLEKLNGYKTQDWDNKIISAQLYETASLYIKNNIFNNLEIGLKLMSNVCHGEDYYEFLSEDIKFNPLIIDLIFIKRRSVSKGSYVYSSNIELYINKEKGNDTNWLKSFFKEYGQYIHYNLFKKNPNSFINWYEDKEKIKEILSTKMAEETHYLFEIIPKKLINSSDLIDNVIKNCPLIYYYLTDSNKKKYMLPLIENIDTFRNKDIYIPHDDIYALNDKKLLLTLLDKENQMWLENPKCPKDLSEDMDFVFHPNVNFMKLLDNKKVIKAVLKNDEYIMEGLRRAKNFYSMLPYEKQLNVDFGLLTLSNNNDSFNKPYHPHLLNSKRFCLEAMRIDKRIISEISPHLWNDKDFLSNVCKIMDTSKHLANRILVEGNAKLATLFEAYEVKNNFEDFMNSYILQTNMNENLQNKDKEVKKGKKI